MVCSYYLIWICHRPRFGLSLLTLAVLKSEVHGQQHYQVLKHKYIGLGKENTTQEEWTENIHRDTYNSLQGHAGLLEYLTLAQNSPSKRQTRIELLRKMGQTKQRSREE